MKTTALLLAAGLGTRLRPVTDHIPKCLIKVGGEPLLGRWIKKLKDVSCDDIIINTHYKAEMVTKYIEDNWNSSGIHIQHEEELLGTAGSLKRNKHLFLEGVGLMIHADNCTDIDLDKLISSIDSRPKRCLLTMQTFTTRDPQSCGIVDVDRDGVVRSFWEKSSEDHGYIANGAIYAFTKELLDYIEEQGNEAEDFSTGVLPQLLDRIYTVHTEDNYLDIGKFENLVNARRIWRKQHN